MCLLIVSIGCVVNIYFVKINFLQGKISTHSFNPVQADCVLGARRLQAGRRGQASTSVRVISACG